MSKMATSHSLPLPGLMRAAIAFTALIDLAIGLAFFFGPELQLVLWPTPIAPVLLRFIGSIVTANGVGAVLAARQGTWEGARVLFAVALVYGAVVLLGLLYHLLRGTAAPIFWLYTVADALFLIPIGYLFWRYEQASRVTPVPS